MVNAPSTPGIYEYNKTTGVFTPLVAYEVVDGVIAGQLTPDYSLRGTTLSAPYSLTLVSKTATSISVSWTEDVDATTAAHRVYLNGVAYGTDLSAAARSASIVGLTASTPYTITVTRLNPLGQESPASNALPVTTRAATAGVPAAPTALTRTALTDTSATFSITEAADATVLRHWRYLDGVRFGTSLAANATSASWTGLTAGSSHSVYVTRENATGESDPSPVKSFTTTGGSSTVAHDVVTGVPNNDEIGDLRLNTWAAARVYDFNKAQATVNLWGCRVLGLTDSGSGNQGTTATAANLRAFLEGFYYTTAGVAKNTGIEVHWAVGNEIDKDAGYTSGNLPANYIETVRLCYNVVHTLNGDGTRRYPMASCWVDMTQHQIQTNGSGPRFKAIAQYLDGMACSMYPPGRDLSKKRDQGPRPDFTPYGDFCDPVMAVMADWFATYPNCRQFATWEFGIPVDHADWIAGANKDRNGAPTSSTNITIRPRYATGGIDSSGHDWVGFLQYIYNKLDAMGVAMREQMYWNQCSNPDIPNQLKWDKQPATSPDTETAWHNWQPGTRLAHG